MPITQKTLQSIYRRRARHYDLSSLPYRLLGLDIEACRRRAIERLGLRQGDRVLDLGCGTGMNFELLLERIGTEGRLLGVDFSPEMLSRAKEKIHRRKWKNVQLIQADIETYEFPMELAGIVSTNVFGFIRSYDDVIRRAARALPHGGKIVIQDSKRPANWPEWLFRMAIRLGRPYGITPAFYAGQPWESLKAYFQKFSMEELYFGLEYIASGEKPAVQDAMFSKPPAATR